jgi:hypothetical protein
MQYPILTHLSCLKEYLLNASTSISKHIDTDLYINALKALHYIQLRSYFSKYSGSLKPIFVNN